MALNSTKRFDVTLIELRHLMESRGNEGVEKVFILISKQQFV